MEFLELKNISERYMELVNPSSPEKVVKIGHVLGLNENSRVIEFGCGYGEILALWAEHFGVSGVGIDIRQHAAPGGGLVIATGNVLQPGTSLENYLAARQATRDYGAYPIDVEGVDDFAGKSIKTKEMQ